MPYWNLYLENHGFNKFEIGVLAFIGLLGRIIAPTCWGILADKTGKRVLLIKIACLVQAIGWCVIALMPQQFLAFATVLLFFSLFQNGIVGQIELLTLLWIKKIHANYGRIRLWGSLGFVCAVAGFGFYFDYFSVLQLPWIMLVFSLIALFNAFFVPDIHEYSVKQHHANSFFNHFKQPHVMAFFTIVFVMLLSHAPAYNFYSNYLEGYHYSKSTIGILWAIAVLAETLMFTQTSKLLEKYSMNVLLASCIMGASIRWLIIGLYPESLFFQIFAQLFHSLTFALMHVLTMQYIVKNFASNQQGTMQGINSMIWGLAVGIGAFLSGAVWDEIGGQMVFYIASVVVLSSLFLVGKIQTKPSVQ